MYMCTVGWAWALLVKARDAPESPALLVWGTQAQRPREPAPWVGSGKDSQHCLTLSSQDP